MVTYHEITPTGLANLKQEVEDLKTIRPAKIKNLADAAALGIARKMRNIALLSVSCAS